MLAACTEPRYTFDAGHADAAVAEHTDPAEARFDGAAPLDVQLDGGAPEDALPTPDPSADAALAPWHAPLADLYAISIRFYSKNRALADRAVYAHDIVMLGAITREGEHVFMDARRCADHGRVTALGLEDEFWWPYADRLPPQRFELVQRPDGIRTAAPPRMIGFSEINDCPSGTKRKVEGRPWLADSMCECRSEPLPTTTADCRIIDDDQDGRPGVTINHRGLLNDPEVSRALDTSQITQAKLTPDGRLSGYFVENYDFLALECAGGPCPKGTIVACPLTLNPVLFEPLGDKADGSAWTCADVMSEVNAGQLFPLPMLIFVDGC